MAETWWSTVFAEIKRRLPISALRRPSLSKVRISASRVVRPAGCARVLGRRPRGTWRLPKARSRPATRAAAACISRCSSATKELRRLCSSLKSAKARAASSGQPRRSHCRRAAPARPDICHRKTVGHHRGRRSFPAPARQEERSNSPAVHGSPTSSARGRALAASVRARASSPANQAASARAMETGPKRWSSPVRLARSSASSRGGHGSPSPRRARTRPRIVRG